MQTTLWLSYDLGVRADYTSLYQWLDDMDAVECGNNLACLKLEITDENTIPEYVKCELEAHMAFGKGDRLYLVWRNAQGISQGRFIIGKRKARPWQGFGKASSDEDDV